RTSGRTSSTSKAASPTSPRSPEPRRPSTRCASTSRRATLRRSRTARTALSRSRGAPTTRASSSPTSTSQATLSSTSRMEAAGGGGRRFLYGTRIEEREEGRDYPLSGIGSAHFTANGAGVLVTTTLFDDAGSPGYLAIDGETEIEPVAVEGIVHSGRGELERL